MENLIAEAKAAVEANDYSLEGEERVTRAFVALAAVDEDAADALAAELGLISE
jgi:hypothetical protein